MKRYPKEIKAFIAENVKGMTAKALAKLVNDKFGTDFTESKMKSYKANYKLKSGLRGYFKKGHIPFNKGMKGLSQGGKETQFKPGNKPANWVPVGSERVNAYGYVDVKIQDGKLQKNWKAKHILLWEEANGPVPKGHALLFADGNKQNVVLENLLLVSRRKLAVLNKQGLISKDPELTKTGAAIADIVLKIGDRKRRKS